MDREKVSYGLRCMCYGDVECKECPYAKDGSGWHDCRSNCAKDALDLMEEQHGLMLALEQSNAVNEYLNAEVERLNGLLKEQEAVKPIPYHRNDGTIFKFECRKCRTKIFKNDLFCRHCGKAVKWE